MRIARINITLVGTAAAGLLLASWLLDRGSFTVWQHGTPDQPGLGTDPTTAPTAPHAFPVMPGSPPDRLPLKLSRQHRRPCQAQRPPTTTA